MLTRIEIHNFAIIDHIALDLGPGLSILSGETGAGKSILIDALGLVLGDRASADTVRPGARRTEITAEFDIGAQPEALEWLREQSLDEDGQCLLRRVIEADGSRSRAFINGRASTTQAVRTLGGMLVDIHGQHEHQSLMRRDAQRALVDGFGQHTDLTRRVADIYRQWRECTDELQRLQGDDREGRLELLRYQVQELEALDLQTGEISELDEEHRRQANVGRLVQQGQHALNEAYEGEEFSAHSLATRAAAEIGELVELDAGFQPVLELFNSAVIQLQEGADTLRHHLDRLEVDPERLQWLEERLRSLHDLGRKHRVTPQELPEKLDQLRTELEQLDQADERIQALERQRAELQTQYAETADALTAKRTAAGTALAEQVSTIMQTLGMPEGRLTIEVTSDEQRFSAQGRDQVEIQVSMNPGQPLRPLSKVASGGELSRISLAIQVVAANNNSIPCMIFDEVDSGIGGAVAEIVGQQLSRLASDRQVMCVTHLPQVASFANTHFQVSKQSDGDNTLTRITPLDARQQVEELARMLGGVEITERTREHAREMIEKKF